MARYSQADYGLEFLRCVADDGRMSRDELVEIISFAANSFVEGEVDKAKAAHAASLLCSGFVSSRGSREPGSFGRHPYEGLDEPFARGGAPAKISAEEIIRAHRKALGETVVELPSNPTAIAILRAAAKARNEPEPKL